MLQKIKKWIGKLLWCLRGTVGATIFPGALDSYSTKNAGDVIQEGHVNDLQDAIKTVEAKIGVNGSAVSISHDYMLAHGARMIQVVNYQTGAVNTGAVPIPSDDTIPQKTEGTELMTLAVTPASIANKLKIDVTAVLASSDDTYMTVAIFQDTTDNALAAVTHHLHVPSNQPQTITFSYYMIAGTTSETTFKVRAGGHGAGTMTFNGWGGVRKMGGIMASGMTITEIKA